MPLQQSVQRVKNKLPIEEIPDPRLSPQRSRGKVISNSRRGNDSKEPPIDLPLESQQTDEQAVDPFAESVQKLHVDIDTEIQKRELLLDQEIEELKKRYR